MLWPRTKKNMAISTESLWVPNWPLPEGVGCAITTRLGGFSKSPYDSNNLGLHVGDSRAAVKQNRTALLRRLPDVQAIQWLNQVHGTDVVEASGAAVVPQADACVSRQPGLACSVMTADCLPLLIAAADGTQVAAVHAGWRGLAAGIIGRTLARFDGDVSVYLGPAIGPACFEVGPEVRDAFHWAPDHCFQPATNGRLLADLYHLAGSALLRHGVRSVYGGDACTYSEAQRFYSYRRDGITGRMASLIWIKR